VIFGLAAMRMRRMAGPVMFRDGLAFGTVRPGGRGKPTFILAPNYSLGE